jgi:hypothetical protein
MGPKFALTDIFRNKMGRGYLLMNPKKSEVCTSAVFVSLMLMILNLLVIKLNAGWVAAGMRATMKGTLGLTPFHPTPN